MKTGVDELMELLVAEKRISLPDAAKRLKQPEKIVQNWVDFLIEEKLLGIEYKFTTPFIYLNTPNAVPTPTKTVDTIPQAKAEFAHRARDKGMPEQKIPELWRTHLAGAVDAKYEFFKLECQKRQLPVEELFKRYREKVLAEWA